MKKLLLLLVLVLSLTISCVKQNTIVNQDMTANTENANTENVETESNIILDNSENSAINENTGDDKMSDQMSNIVLFETSMGNFEVKLNPDKAPITVENFLSYVKDGFYDNLIFHRVIDGFMVQGGGFDKDMNQKETKEPIKNEADNGLKNEKYTVAMARTMVVDSATSQFFINVEDNSFLDHQGKTPQGWGYAVFGKVISGTDTIDKIKAVETGTSGMYQDVPVEPVIINKAYVK